MKIITIVAMLFAWPSSFLFGQTSTSHVVRIIANPILELKFDETHDNRDFNFTSLADYDNGKTNLQASGLKVRSNKNWVVSVKANSATFLPSSSGERDIESTAIMVRKSGTNYSIPIDVFDKALASGTNGGFDKNNFLIDYIANPGYIRPDTYSLEIVYTLTTP